MKVLIACEESQAVTIEFRKLGHEAYSCDLVDCSGGHPEWHITQDVLPLLNGYCTFQTCDGVQHNITGKWDLIIAFPPCTYLSNAGACRLYPQKGVLNMERYQKGLNAKEFFLKFLNADCPHIAVENPVSSTVFNMPKHSQEIQPHQFGHPFTKKTRLWLVNLPPYTQQLQDYSRRGRTYLPELEAKIGRNTVPPNVVMTQKTVRKHFTVLRKPWQNNGV